MNNKAIIYEFLTGQKHMTLATASLEGRPEAATVGYVVDGDLLLINTFENYRKYENLKANPLVACVITTGEDKTLQIECAVWEAQGTQADNVRQKIADAGSSSQEFLIDKSTRFFILTPTWFRLRDYTQEPMQVIEYTAG
jgi:hypothetical protein